MSSSYGENIKLTIFGQSHSAAIGMTLDGVPAGNKIDIEAINAFMKRRAPGQNNYSTPRKEADIPEFLSGLKDDTTCGAPITAIIRNNNTRSSDYDTYRFTPRPGHADYTAAVKYFNAQDYTGGGHFSGRLTAPLCIAGAICIQLLKQEGIEIISRISSIGEISDKGELVAQTASKEFPVVCDDQGRLMREYIENIRRDCDSVGGIIECKILNLPVGLGDPIFDGMENRIASAVFGIPAVKGIQFGKGYESAKLKGSQNNDQYDVTDGKIYTLTNNCGGILGGITNGMPLIFDVAIKPTPSIAKEQLSVNINTMTQESISVIGRHDPCIVPRAVPCVEAAAAISVYDALLSRKKELR